MFRLLMAVFVTIGLALAAAPLCAHAQIRPVDAPELKEWFYAVEANVTGPMGLTELRQLAGTVVKATTQVYVERNGWREAKDHPEIADLFAVAAAPMPPAVPAPPPPPAVPTQEALDAAATSYLAGTWRSEFPSEMQGVKYRNVVDVTYMPDGKLVGLWSTFEQSGAIFLALQMEGTYTIKATSKVNFILSQRWRYTNAKGPPPVDPEKAYDSGTSSLDIVDANTLKSATGTNLSHRLR